MANDLARQAFALRARFQTARTKLTPTRFVWIGMLQPSAMSRLYRVRVTLCLGQYPRVEVLDPVIEARPGESIPHLFGDGSLCLHLEDEWRTDMLMVDTTVPWTAEWLLNYEIWRATGIWYGGGQWPPRRGDAGEDGASTEPLSLSAAES